MIITLLIATFGIPFAVSSIVVVFFNKPSAGLVGDQLAEPSTRSNAA
jgi:hypothetical protein